MHTQNTRKTYGRKMGRPLGKGRMAAMSALLPSVEIRAETLPEDHSLDPSTFFPAPLTEYWFEIGFGGGEHLAGLLRRHPEHGFFGAEPFLNGIASLLKDIETHSLSNLPPLPIGGEGRGEGALCTKNIPENIRVLNEDAMRLARSLTPQSLDGIYILNPDPWPKKRHHNRRIVRPETLDVFAKILKSGGHLIMSTDVDDLAEWMVTHATNHPDFTWTARSKADWHTMPPDWIPTRYEQKGIAAGRKQSYLTFVRK